MRGAGISSLPLLPAAPFLLPVAVAVDALLVASDLIPSIGEIT